MFTFSGNYALLPKGTALVPVADREQRISVLVLDSSGSMEVYGAGPAEAVNELINTLRRATNAQYWVSVVTFADAARVEVPLTRVASVQPMTRYRASGSTLLWRTVKHVLSELIEAYQRLDPTAQHKVKVFVAVFSDGQDNQSPRPRYPGALQIESGKALALGFGLKAVGIGIDGKRMARGMGFPEQDAVTVEASPDGIGEATTHTTGWTTR